MKSKKIMILGGGKYQRFLIETALNEGYEVLFCGAINSLDNSRENLILRNVNYLDREAILAIAREENVDGIMSNSEFAMRTVAYVAEKMGLPGSPLESVLKLNQKSAFRKLQHELGLFAPNYILTSSFDEACRNVHTLHFPVVLKPNHSSGSRGTKVIDTPDDFINAGAAWQVCSDFSMDDLVVIEEYVEMERLDGYVEQDIFVLGDRIIWDGIDTCMRSSKMKKVAMTDVFPIVADESQFEKIKAVIEKIIRGAGIVHGEYNMEMYRFPNDELFMIEINARQGGFGGPAMMQLHTGIDYNKLLVTTAVGDNAYFDEVYQKAKNNELTKRLVCRQPVMPTRSGTFKDIFISPEIMPYVIGKTLQAQPGATVAFDSVTALDVFGYVDLEFPTRDLQLSYVDRIEELIYPEYSD